MVPHTDVSQVNCIGSCANEFVCVHGVCQSVNASSCTSSSACNVGQQCVNGTCKDAECHSSQLFWLGTCWPSVANITANQSYTQTGVVFVANPSGSVFPDQSVFDSNIAFIEGDMMYFNSNAPFAVPTGTQIVYLTSTALVYFDGTQLVQIDNNGVQTDNFSLSYGGYALSGNTVTSGFTGTLNLLASDKRYFTDSSLVFEFQSNTIAIDVDSNAHIISANIENVALRNGSAVVSFQ